MTDIQIKFWQTVELQRANRAAEEEKRRANVAQEHETHRTNVTHESLTQRDIAERERHNRASEDIERLRAQISAVQANAAARQAAVAEKLAYLNSQRYELEKTLNAAQVNKITAEQYKLRAETSLARSQQYLNEGKLQESYANRALTEAKTQGQLVQNEVSAAGKYGTIASAYTKPASDVVSILGNLTKSWDSSKYLKKVWGN